MPRNIAPYRNKMKTPTKVVARIALDLIKADQRKQILFNSNGPIGSPPSTPDPESAYHDILSLTHEDSDPAAAILGDLITAQGGTPLWSRLTKGTLGQVLTMLDADNPGWADAGELTPIGPTLIVVGRTATIDCGAVTEDAIDTFVDVSCQNMGSGIVFKAAQSMARIGGRITYYWYIDSGDLRVKIFNDSDVDVYVMAWFGSPNLVVCEGPFDVRTVVANTVATTADKILYCTAGGITVTLYTAVGNTGRDLYIDNDSVGNVIVDGDGVETIENELTQTLTPDTSIHIYSTGAKWRII